MSSRPANPAPTANPSYARLATEREHIIIVIGQAAHLLSTSIRVFPALTANLVKKGENMKLNVQAIFDSIDGEENAFGGAGELTTFIRLKGCNLRCGYCDTKYSQEAKPENWMTVDEAIQQIHFPKVTITGGEPLLQKEALEELCNRLRYYSNNKQYSRVSIETNGSILPTYFTHDIRYVVDYKLPSSGVTKHMKSSTFYALRYEDVIKFVISDIEDYEYAKRQIQMHTCWGAKKVFSPALGVLEDESVCRKCNGHEVHDGKCYNCKTKASVRFSMDWPRQLAEMMIRDRVRAQYSLQLHKILWPGAKEER